MRWSLLAGVVVLAGCESTTEVRPQPQPQPRPQAAEAPDPEPQDSGAAIVIRGSKPKTGDDAPRDDPARRNQDKIDELKRQAAEGGATGSWTEFSSSEGRFRILLPEAPQSFARNVAAGNGTSFVMHMASVTTKKPEARVYLVSWADVPDTGKATMDQMLSQVAAGQAIATHGRLLEDRPITVDGNEGHETLVDVGNGVSTRARVFIIGSRCYQVIVSAPTASAGSRDVFRFIESLKITR